MKLNADENKILNARFEVSRWLDGVRPTAAVVLGSGLGGYAARAERSVAYEEIGFPRPAVRGHDGRLHLTADGGTLLLAGRVHAYEGHPLSDVVFAVRALARLGVDTFIVTCASGGVNTEYRPGELVIIRDHLNLALASPLRGMNADAFGPRFPDMTAAYDPELRAFAQAAARSCFNSELREGVYAMMPGPQYETPAEVRMLRALGADLAGMSTVPEVIALRHMGRRVLGLSCVTNHAAGVTDQPLSHAEVVETAAKAAERFATLLDATLERIHAAEHPSPGPV